MKKILRTMIVLAIGMMIVGCGNTGVPQEEYDKIVAERDVLQEEYDKVVSERDGLQEKLDQSEKITEMKVKAAQYQASIESEIKHAEFALYILGKIGNVDARETSQKYVESGNQAILGIKTMIDMTVSVGESIDVGKESYQQTIDGIEGIYDGWRYAYKVIEDLEKELMERMK